MNMVRTNLLKIIQVEDHNNSKDFRPRHYHKKIYKLQNNLKILDSSKMISIHLQDLIKHKQKPHNLKQILILMHLVILPPIWILRKSKRKINPHSISVEDLRVSEVQWQQQDLINQPLVFNQPVHHFRKMIGDSTHHRDLMNLANHPTISTNKNFRILSNKINLIFNSIIMKKNRILIKALRRKLSNNLKDKSNL